MVRFIEMGIAYAAAGQSYCRASAGFAERDMCSTNANGGRDTAFAEDQANGSSPSATPVTGGAEIADIRRESAVRSAHHR
jgi:hypothetical protein